DEIDTGAVILTGEAIRRENARAIANLLAVQGGNFVCASAGHNMESLLAAYGSGAVQLSYNRGCRILNIDIGGGTTKLALVENGRVRETAALYAGGRLLVVDENGRIARLDPGGEHIANLLGMSLRIGEVVTADQMNRMASWMADAILTAVLKRPLPSEIEQLYLTDPLQDIEHVDGIMFSGGVGEYIYNREDREFGDLGKLLGTFLRRKVDREDFPWPWLPAGECIRATVLGASEHSVQVSGNTIFISDPELLPVRNLQVLRPDCDLRGRGEIDSEKLAQAIRDHFALFDLTEGEAEVALAFNWTGEPSYERVSAFVRGLENGLRSTIQNGKPLVLVFDGDIARTVGALLQEECGVNNAILSIDGITLQDFEFIDIGELLEPSGTVPVTIKSLIFRL
ncbi:ethanolamine ammonia-lyase reactivating factor EutA, partial [Effusibacillus lacus]